MQLERKFVVDFQSVCVNNIRKNRHPQKQENLNNTIFFVEQLHKTLEMTLECIFYTLPMMVMISVLVYDIWQWQYQIDFRF